MPAIIFSDNLSARFEYGHIWSERHKADVRWCKAVIKGSSGVVIGRGYAECSVQDRFSKAFGRRLAFARALSDAQFGRPSRSAAWRCFLRHCKIPGSKYERRCRRG